MKTADATTSDDLRAAQNARLHPQQHGGDAELHEARQGDREGDRRRPHRLRCREAPDRRTGDHDGLDAVAAGRPLAVPGAQYKLAASTVRLAPRSLLRALARRYRGV